MNPDSLHIQSKDDWRKYFRNEIQDGLSKGESADRFNQYLVRFQGADLSVYISNLEETQSDGLKWHSGERATAAEDSLMDGGFRNHKDLSDYLSKETPDSVKFRLIAIDAISTEAIQILGHRYNMAPEFFQNRTYMGRKSHETKLYSTTRQGKSGAPEKHLYTVIEAIDYVWLGKGQPEHLQHESGGHCAFEFETPYEEGNYPLFHPAFLWRSNAMVMSTMPRKISFYLITGGKTTVCLVFLETIARARPREEAPCTLHLSSRQGTTVIWQQSPVIIRGMYFTYFLFDCFGCYQPPPWDSQAYNSCLEKMENNRKLAADGLWAICTFFRTLGALTQFTLVGWNERLGMLGREALDHSHLWLAKELHMHLDDLYFHQEKSNLHIRLAKVILDDTAFTSELQPNIREFLKEYVRSSEYRLQRFDRLEKKIQNTIELIFNTVTIQEAQTSSSQNERIGYLTILATFFIPLTYLASLFGMNVSELDKESTKTLPSLRIYWVVALPVTFLVFFATWVMRVFARTDFFENLGSYLQDLEERILNWTTARLGSRKKRSRFEEKRVRDELVLLNMRVDREIFPDSKELEVVTATSSAMETPGKQRGKFGIDIITTPIMERGPGLESPRKRAITWGGFGRRPRNGGTEGDD